VVGGVGEWGEMMAMGAVLRAVGQEWCANSRVQLVWTTGDFLFSYLTSIEMECQIVSQLVRRFRLVWNRSALQTLDPPTTRCPRSFSASARLLFYLSIIIHPFFNCQTRYPPFLFLPLFPYSFFSSSRLSFLPSSSF